MGQDQDRPLTLRETAEMVVEIIKIEIPEVGLGAQAPGGEIEEGTDQGDEAG